MSVQRSAEPNPLDSTGLCLLSLDGGGVRGLSTLYILKRIMDRLNLERKTTGNLPPVKPRANSFPSLILLYLSPSNS